MSIFITPYYHIIICQELYKFGRYELTFEQKHNQKLIKYRSDVDSLQNNTLFLNLIKNL